MKGRTSIIALLLGLAIGCLAQARHAEGQSTHASAAQPQTGTGSPTSEVVATPSASSSPSPSPDTDTLRRGAQLAAVGDCMVCHTAQGGKPFAGGLPIRTPFGTIFTTNITPDPET